MKIQIQISTGHDQCNRWMDINSDNKDIARDIQVTVPATTIF